MTFPVFSVLVLTRNRLDFIITNNSRQTAINTMTNSSSTAKKLIAKSIQV